IRVVVVDVVAQHVAGLVSGADTGVNVHAVQGIADQAERQVSLDVGMLADGAAVTIGNGRDRVRVGVIAEGGNTVGLRPGIEHRHAHAVVVGDHNVDGIAEGSGPGADSVAGSGGVPSGACGVLHLLRSQLTDRVVRDTGREQWSGASAGYIISLNANLAKYTGVKTRCSKQRA